MWKYSINPNCCILCKHVIRRKVTSGIMDTMMLCGMIHSSDTWLHQVCGLFTFNNKSVPASLYSYRYTECPLISRNPPASS